MKATRLMIVMRSRTVAFVHDLSIIPFAWLAAYWLRFNLETVPQPFLATALKLLPLLMVIQGGVFLLFGLYRGVWRFASIPDFVRIAKAVFFGVITSLAIIFLVTRMQNIPRSVIPLYSLLLFFLLSGNRLLYRWLKDYRINKFSGKRVLIVGAGEAANVLVRDMLLQHYRQYLPVAVVDDNQSKIGRELQGIRVHGDTSEIPSLVNRLNIDLILIAIPSLTSEKMRRLVEYCERSNVAFRTLPKFEDLVSGQVTTTALRNVSIEDLLGREKIELDWNLIHTELSGKKIMVSGGGGSIGSELCRQIANLAPSILIVFERNEYYLYRTAKNLEKSFPQVNIKPVLGDICDVQSINNVFDRYSPDIIFHAAAYKQVPLLQLHAREAANNNVLGTVNVAEAANRTKAEKFVLISTDKAVNPINILGQSKRLAELYCQGMDQSSDTRFITVRFGNVLGSDGSVVQLFKEQIVQGGPVTVTHPEIERYFMTIREASQLILQAVAIKEPGDVFILDMGDPVKITYLAEQMIRLSGKEPGKEIQIEYIGLRAGEKLYEELFYTHESNEKTRNAKILRARHNRVDIVKLKEVIYQLRLASDKSDIDIIEKIMQDSITKIYDQSVNADNVIKLPK